MKEKRRENKEKRKENMKRKTHMDDNMHYWYQVDFHKNKFFWNVFLFSYQLTSDDLV
jgi:hypothetical protein